MDKLNSFDFKKFYIIHYDRCFLFAKSYVHDGSVAEDITSEAFIKIWELLSEVEEVRSPLRLLYVILKNKALDYLKHEKIKQNALAQISMYARRELEIRISTLEAGNPDKIFANEIQHIVHTTLSNLPGQTKKVFEMSRLKNMSKKEIADYFNISVKGVDYHISKALAYLKKNLRDYFPLLLYININIF